MKGFFGGVAMLISSTSISGIANLVFLHTRMAQNNNRLLLLLSVAHL